MSVGIMLFSPFTGQPRDPRDVISDPRGLLVWDGEEPLRNAVALKELLGSFDAAASEGLTEALAETTDERLKDLVQRRLIAGFESALREAGDTSLTPPVPGTPRYATAALVLMAMATISNERWVDKNENAAWFNFADEITPMADAFAKAMCVPENDGPEVLVEWARQALAFVGLKGLS